MYACLLVRCARLKSGVVYRTRVCGRRDTVQNSPANGEKCHFGPVEDVSRGSNQYSSGSGTVHGSLSVSLCHELKWPVTKYLYFLGVIR